MDGGRRGFTFMELVVAMFVFTTAALAIIGALLAAQALAEGSRNLTSAVTDARTVLERIRRDVQASPDVATFADPAASPEYEAADYEAWVGSQQVAGTGFLNLTNEQVDVAYGNPGGDPLDVTVTVTWTERGGRQRTATLQTQMTRR